MRQPTGSPRLYTLFSVQFFGLPGPKKYAMSPRRIRLPVFWAGACADTCSEAIASPAMTTTDDRMMVSVLRIPDLLCVSSTTNSGLACLAEARAPNQARAKADAPDSLPEFGGGRLYSISRDISARNACGSGGIGRRASLRS